MPENSRLTFFLLQLHSHNLLLNFAHVEHRKITSMDVLFNCTVPHLWERKENRVVAQKNCSKRFIAYRTDKRRPLFVSIHANETKRIPNRGEKNSSIQEKSFYELTYTNEQTNQNKNSLKILCAFFVSLSLFTYPFSAAICFSFRAQIRVFPLF